MGNKTTSSSSSSSATSSSFSSCQPKPSPSSTSTSTSSSTRPKVGVSKSKSNRDKSNSEALIEDDNMDSNSDVKVTDQKSELACSREPALVAKIAAIKEEQARDMAREARNNIISLKNILKKQVNKTDYVDILARVAKARTRAWKKAQDRHDRKIQFLKTKHENCCTKHINQKIMVEKIKTKPGEEQKIRNDADPLIAGTAVSDEDLEKLFNGKCVKHAFNEKEVMTFGDVDLDDDERALLQKRPEFALFDSIQDSRLSEEFTLTLTKVIWDRESRGLSQKEQEEELDLCQEENLKVQEEEDRIRLEDSQARLILDPDSNTVNLGARRATDMRHNQRLTLPHHRPPLEEAVLSTRQMVWREAANRYKLDNCNDKGEVNTHNLNASERVGLNKLKKRVKAGVINILKSDKGNRFVVSSTASFERQGDLHTLKDRMIGQGETEQIQTRMNNLSRGLSKIFKIGNDWGDKNAQRCWNNLSTEACVVPLLYPSPKIHKPPTSEGDPQSRPIVQDSSCITSRPGEIVADVLEAVLHSAKRSQECQSTEDMLAKIDLARDVIEAEGDNICVGSGDVVALYPSLLHEHSAEVCADLIRNSPADFSNIDSRAAGIFLATHTTRTEVNKTGLSKFVPLRKFSRGHKPTSTTLELTSRNNDCPTKFTSIAAEPNMEERKTLLAKVIEIAVLSIIRNHVYSWKGQTWVQTQGVPTGLRLSGIIGRISMDVWMTKMTSLMINNEMKTYLLEKYVDDCNTLLENLAPGSRWDGEGQKP